MFADFAGFIAAQRFEGTPRPSRYVSYTELWNVASRLTIERNGGVYEDTREGKLRFWVTATAPVPNTADLNAE